jgi:hypothetical protein
MSIIVRRVSGQWVEWNGPALVQQLVNTRTIVYQDGRRVDEECEPYPVEVQQNGNSIRNFYDQGIWSLAEVEAVGGKVAVPFPVPEGMQTVGSALYLEEAGEVYQFYNVEDIPLPPPDPTPEEKATNMLSNWGLTLAEFKAVMADPLLGRAAPPVETE